MLTDIKPPIFHRLMEEKGEELNGWVIGELKADLQAISVTLAIFSVPFLAAASAAALQGEILMRQDAETIPRLLLTFRLKRRQRVVKRP